MVINMVAIIDYDAGNIKSVEKALHYLGEEAVITRDRDTILGADRVILPGVGAFGDAMEKLRTYELDKVIQKVVAQNTPFLGICLGLQLLFESSEESESVEGLGILKGKVVRLPEESDMKIPHIGWNSLKYPNPGRLFTGCGRFLCIFRPFLLSTGERPIYCNSNYRIWNTDSCFC